MLTFFVAVLRTAIDEIDDIDEIDVDDIDDDSLPVNIQQYA